MVVRAALIALVAAGFVVVAAPERPTHAAECAAGSTPTSSPGTAATNAGTGATSTTGRQTRRSRRATGSSASASATPSRSATEARRISTSSPGGRRPAAGRPGNGLFVSAGGVAGRSRAPGSRPWVRWAGPAPSGCKAACRFLLAHGDDVPVLQPDHGRWPAAARRQGRHDRGRPRDHRRHAGRRGRRWLPSDRRRGRDAQRAARRLAGRRQRHRDDHQPGRQLRHRR